MRVRPLARAIPGAIFLLVSFTGVIFRAAVASPAQQPVDFREIAGSPLRIQVGANASIQVFHQKYEHGATYGAGDSGFFIAIGSDVYGPDLPNTNPSSAGNTTNRLN